MAAINLSAAALTVTGDDLQPCEITRLLGCAPSRSFSRGDRVSPTRETLRKHGAWILNADDCEPEDLNAQVSMLLGMVTHDMAVWHALGARYYVSLFCGLFMGVTNEGAGLSGASLLALGERGIALDLDIYAPTIDKPENPPPAASA